MSDKEAGKRDLAIALRYDGQNAPRITAKGRGQVADRILGLADEHGVPLREDPELAALLSQVPLGDEIPEALYRAVAEVIAFAYLLSGKRPPGYEPTIAPPPPPVGPDQRPIAKAIIHSLKRDDFTVTVGGNCPSVGFHDQEDPCRKVGAGNVRPRPGLFLDGPPLPAQQFSRFQPGGSE